MSGEEKVKTLSEVFMEFSNNALKKASIENTRMTQRQFSKLCQNSELICKKKKERKEFTKNDCDIIFIKSVPKGKKKADFTMFKEALGFVALQKFANMDPKEAYSKVVGMVIKTEQQYTSVTKTDKVPLHDDKSSYTGVYKKGGPKAITDDKSLKALTSRGKADARGVPLPKTDQ